MSRMISRLLLSISMIPAAVGVFLAGFVVEAAGLSREQAGVVGAIAALGFVYVYWTLVWRSHVKWSLRRCRNSMIALAGSLAAGIAAGSIPLFVGFDWVSEPDVFFFLGALAAATTWLIFSSLAWRETDGERAERLEQTGVAASPDVLLCPACGYAMTGLKLARCPECGAEYTLDGLLAANLERLRPDVDLSGP